MGKIEICENETKNQDFSAVVRYKSTKNPTYLFDSGERLGALWGAEVWLGDTWPQTLSSPSCPTLTAAPEQQGKTMINRPSVQVAKNVAPTHGKTYDKFGTADTVPKA